MKSRYNGMTFVKDLKIGGYTAYFTNHEDLIITEGETIEEAGENLLNAYYDILMYAL